MKKLLMIVLICSLLPVITFGQASLTINDTRDVNDLPNFSPNAFRLDFKPRHIIGVPGVGVFSTNMTICPWSDNTGAFVHQLNFNDGGIYYRTGVFFDSAWSGWQKLVIENSAGNVGIGTVSPAYKLDVSGTIRAREIKVNLDGADFVFENDYSLMPLNELEAFIKKNKHLPEIASAKEMEENAVELGKLNAQLLRKIEELTLYTIEQQKEISILKKQNEELEKQGEQLSELRQKVNAIWTKLEFSE